MQIFPSDGRTESWRILSRVKEIGRDIACTSAARRENSEHPRTLDTRAAEEWCSSTRTRRSNLRAPELISRVQIKQPHSPPLSKTAGNSILSCLKQLGGKSATCSLYFSVPLLRLPPFLIRVTQCSALRVNEYASRKSFRTLGAVDANNRDPCHDRGATRPKYF